jgi:hypothetical protein
MQVYVIRIIKITTVTDRAVPLVLRNMSLFQEECMDACVNQNQNQNAQNNIKSQTQPRYSIHLFTPGIIAWESRKIQDKKMYRAPNVPPLMSLPITMPKSNPRLVTPPVPSACTDPSNAIKSNRRKEKNGGQGTSSQKPEPHRYRRREIRFVVVKGVSVK